MLSFRPEGGDLFYCLGRDIPFLVEWYTHQLCQSVPEFKGLNPKDILDGKIFDQRYFEALGFFVLDTILKNR